MFFKFIFYTTKLRDPQENRDTCSYGIFTSVLGRYIKTGGGSLCTTRFAQRESI